MILIAANESGGRKAAAFVCNAAFPGGRSAGILAGGKGGGGEHVA